MKCIYSLLCFSIVSVVSVNVGGSENQYIHNNKSFGFTLTGEIAGLRNGIRVYLIQDSGKDTVASSIIQETRFSLNGTVPNGTEYYYLRLDSNISTKRSEEFLLVNDDLKLVGHFNKWPKIILQGSQPHDEYLEFVKLWQTNIEKSETQRIEAVKSFIEAHQNSLYVADIIRRLQKSFGVSETEKMYAGLTAAAKASHFGKQLAESLDLARKRESVKEYTIIPDFQTTTIDGNKVSIRQLVGESELTLIDFWASWCKPCREQTPNLKKVYTKFHDKGFNIIGVALSDREKDWKRAIREDATTWTHTRDEDNISYNIFDIPAIPGFALVNREGRLLAFDCSGSSISTFGPPIRGEQLGETIANLLKRTTGSSNDSAIRPLKIGDKVPDLPLGEMVNHPSLTSAKISDFRGKLLILDFWSTHCAVCIAQFPHLVQLQHRFGDSIQILPVGFDAHKEGSIKEFIERRKGTSKEMKLPSAIQKPTDTVLMKYFPFVGLPHEVWIDSCGKVVGITDHLAVIESNIASILAGNVPAFSVRKIRKIIPITDRFLIDRKNNEGVFQSAFAGYFDSVRQTSYFYKQDDSSYYGRWINVPVYDLYRVMYEDEIRWGNGSHKKIIVEAKGKDFYQDWKDVRGVDNWAYDKFQQKSLFSYEFTTVPGLSRAQVKQHVIKDLDQYFGINSKVERRIIKCLAVVKAKAKKAGVMDTIAPDPLGSDPENRHVIDQPVSEVIDQLNARIGNDEPLIIDETNNANVSMLFPNRTKMSIEEIRVLLKKYGFDLKVVKRKMKVLVMKNIR